MPNLNAKYSIRKGSVIPVRTAIPFRCVPECCSGTYRDAVPVRTAEGRQYIFTNILSGEMKKEREIRIFFYRINRIFKINRFFFSGLTGLKGNKGETKSNSFKH
jgi:hypothetical protein